SPHWDAMVGEYAHPRGKSSDSRWDVRKLLPVLMVAAIAIAVAPYWLRHHQAKYTSARPGILLISGDTAGWITPCGCTANQSGGLLRRGTYIEQLRRGADVIYADVGGAPAGASEYQRVKFEAILRGEKVMGI